MARTIAGNKTVKQEKTQECNCELIISDLRALLSELIVRVGVLENNASYKATGSRIQKTETFNGEEPFDPDPQAGIKMKYDDKIQSMKNAIAILPPNMVDKDGRHLRENIQAICGFMVDEQMIKEAYGI